MPRDASPAARRVGPSGNFDAEEFVLVGSAVLADHPPAPLRSIVVMLNLDMVARLVAGPLFVDRSDDRPFHALVDSAGVAAHVSVRHSSMPRGSSDDARFASNGVTTLILFSGGEATRLAPPVRD